MTAMLFVSGSKQMKIRLSAFVTLLSIICALGSTPSQASGFKPLPFCPTILMKYHPIAGEEADRLAMESQSAGEGRRAQIFDRFVAAYSRLAQKVARNAHLKNPAVDFADLYQEALLSIGDAMRTFDVKKGHFFHHLQIRMRSVAGRAVIQYYSDLGVGLTSAFGRRYYSNRSKVVQALDQVGLALTAENLTREWNKQFPEWAVKQKELQLVEESFAMKLQMYSLEEQVSPDESDDVRTYRDVVSDPDQESTDQLVAQNRRDQAMRQAVADFVPTLSKYERQLFEQRVLPHYSENGDEFLSLEELGKTRGVSREMTRQNQKKLMQRFKKFLLARGIEP